MSEPGNVFYEELRKVRVENAELVESCQAAQNDVWRLRALLWLNHGHRNVYGDDGEMQCSTCMLDFKRATVPEIEQRFFLRSLGCAPS